ncbi:MAG: glycosyltransferase [Candidatus Sumerlaeaceae bacterium]
MAPTIAFDMSTATPVRTGIGTATFELAARLPFLSSDFDFLYVFHSFRQRLPRLPLLSRRRVRILRRRLPGPLLLQVWQRFDFPCAEMLAPHAELFHAPAMFIPPTHRMPLVATIHDLFFLDAPEQAEHLPWGDAYFQRSLPRRMPHVSRIIVPSRRTAEQVRRHFGSLIPELSQRLHVIPWGVASRFFLRKFPSDKQFLRQLGLDSSYLLTVGGSSRRKNFPALLAAHRLLRDEFTIDIPLVCIGAAPNHRGEAAGARSSVYCLPYLSRRELGIVLRNATVYVAAPHMEGFGMPILEAMAAGVPVVSSANCGVFDFTGAESAYVLAEPTPRALAAAVACLLSDDTLCAERVARARQAAAALTWRRTVRETLGVYEEALKNQ